MKEDKLLKMASVLEYVQISKSKLYEMMAKNEFPKARKIGANSLWKLSEIQEFIEKQAS